MQLIDKKGKLFGILNLLDLLFLISVVLVLLVGYKYISRKTVDTTTENVYFVVELKSVKEDFAKKIKINDQIKDSIKGYYLGKVLDVRIEKEKLTNWDAVGKKFVEVESPEDYTVYVTIIANGSMKNDTIYAETVPVSVGKEISIKGKGYAKTGYIVEVREEAVGEAIQ